MAKRGQLTDQLSTLLKTVTSHEITQQELRLMPYLQYLLLNGQRIDPHKITPLERQVLSDWRKRGWLEGGAGSDLAITYEFWTIINLCLWHAYVIYED